MSRVCGLALCVLLCSACLAAGSIAVDVAAVVRDDAQCDDCKWLVGMAETYVASPANQQMLIQFISTSVCPQLQDPLRQQCLDYTPILVPTAVMWLNTNLPPAVACNDLAMCTALKMLGAIVEEGQSDGLPCPVCKFMLAQLLVQLQDPSNQASMLAGALQMCALLEPAMATDCHHNIETIARKTFMILADVSVDKACVAVKACEPWAQRPAAPHNSWTAAFEKLGSQHLALNDETQCQECQMVANELKSLLTNPDTREQIKAGLKAACGVLQVYEATCEESVNDYADLALNLALQYIGDPAVTCTQMGFCPPPAFVMVHKTIA